MEIKRIIDFLESELLEQVLIPCKKDEISFIDICIDTGDLQTLIEYVKESLVKGGE